MNARLSIGLKWLAAAAVVGMAGWFAVTGIRGLVRPGVEPRIWFYDESEKELYAMPVSAVPPDKGIGGARDDGYRAIVVEFGNPKPDPHTRRIAYLLKYTPDLKKLLDESLLARAAGRIFEGKLPTRESEYFQGNTLVKLPGDSDWHAANTEEGRVILNGWRAWRGADGSQPKICNAN